MDDLKWSQFQPKINLPPIKELKDMTNPEKRSLLMLNCSKIKNSLKKL